MAHDMVCVVICSVGAWKEWVLCCCWVLCSINVDNSFGDGVETGVLRWTMWPPLTLWRGGIVIAEQWWKSWLSTGFPWPHPREWKGHLFMPEWRYSAGFLGGLHGHCEERASKAWWGWKSWPPLSGSCGASYSLVGVEILALNSSFAGMGRAAVFFCVVIGWSPKVIV